jgi:uncharacterized DUF497 family protein
MKPCRRAGGDGKSRTTHVRVCYAAVQFTWNAAKARSNVAKHRVTFEEAATVFLDDEASIFDDPDHSEGEHRELIIGYSVGRRLLLVSFTEPEDDLIRIISARGSDPGERRQHEERR